jgi:hypothetical protein
MTKLPAIDVGKLRGPRRLSGLLKRDHFAAGAKQQAGRVTIS